MASPIPEPLKSLARDVLAQVRASYDALAGRDAGAGPGRSSKAIARSTGSTAGSARTLKEDIRLDAGQLDAWLQLLGTARNLERIADHATDIAQTIVYLEEGIIIRHKVENRPPNRELARCVLRARSTEGIHDETTPPADPVHSLDGRPPRIRLRAFASRRRSNRTAQKPAAGKESVRLAGSPGRSRSGRCRLSAEDFAKLPRQAVKAKGHDGVESQYEGVFLIDILAKAGVPTGNELRGKELTRYVVVEASDGYRAVFAIAELDSAFTDRVILLADRRDGRRLSDREGPLQVIVPGEKKHARWVRQVTRLVVGRALINVAAVRGPCSASGTCRQGWNCDEKMCRTIPSRSIR